MEITKYQNTNGDAMVLIIDKENDTGKSMTEAEYDRQQAEQSTPNLAL
jgi:hypoxanthine phosphoribosyltransferase